MTHKSLSPLVRYQQSIELGLVSYDAAQQHALLCLDELFQQITQTESQENESQESKDEPSFIEGIYLWGRVGRGKTFLMDTFVDSLPDKVCLRQHFHHFMQDIHHKLTELSGQENPLKIIAQQLSEQFQVLCFDEFFVNDIGDAMLLGRLMMFLFECKMIVVATSNCEPDELYKDGLQRDNFLPAIKAIYKNMRVLELGGEKDHRERALNRMQNYFLINESNPAENKVIHDDLLKRFDFNMTSGVINVLDRDIEFIAKNKKCICFDFEQICLGPRSHFDYIEISKLFDTVLLLNVPELGGEIRERIKARGTEDGSVGSGSTGERHVMLATLDDGARRFIALIDELYDQKVKLFLTAHVPLKQLYTKGSLAFQFERAHSRLIEIGSQEYIDQ